MSIRFTYNYWRNCAFKKLKNAEHKNVIKEQHEYQEKRFGEVMNKND